MNVIRSQFDASSITLIDGAGTEFTLPTDAGDFSVDDLTAQGGVEAYQARRTLHGLRRGELAWPSGSMSAMVTSLADPSGDGTIFDFLFGAAPFASRTSTLADSDVVAFDLRFTLPGSLGYDHTLLFEDAHVVASLQEGNPSTVTLNWICYGNIEVDGHPLNATGKAAWMVPYTSVQAATVLATETSSDPVEVVEVEDWSFGLDFTSGSGAGQVAFEIADLPSRLFDENGRCRVFLEIGRPSADTRGFLTVGIWDGTETAAPAIGYGRRPANGAFYRGYLESFDFSVSGSTMTIDNDTSAQPNFEPTLARVEFDFAPDDDRSRACHIQLIDPDGSSVDHLDPTGDTITAGRRTGTATVGVRRYATASREAVAMPRLVVMAKVESDASETVPFRVQFERLHDSETELTV